MTLRLAVLTLLAALSSQSAFAQDTAEAPPAPEWDLIRFEVKSWGAPVTQWQFTPGYGGYWAENTSDQPFGGNYTLAFHTLEADAGRYDALAAIVSRLPDPAPSSEGCEMFMTDMPYGVVRLTRGATTIEIAWNSGCRDEEYVAFMDVLREADELVSTWGREAPVNRTEDFGR